MRATGDSSRITPTVVVLTAMLTVLAVTAGGLGLAAQRLREMRGATPAHDIVSLVNADRVALAWFVSLVVLVLTITIGSGKGAVKSSFDVPYVAGVFPLEIDTSAFAGKKESVVVEIEGGTGDKEGRFLFDLAVRSPMTTAN